MFHYSKQKPRKEKLNYYRRDSENNTSWRLNSLLVVYDELLKFGTQWLSICR